MRIDKAKIRAPLFQESKTLPKQRVSTYTESYKGEYYNIEVSKLIPFKNQSRKNFDQKSLEELAHTIKTHGIRQPLTVLPSEEYEGKYEIISGERRWKAAKIVKLPKIPCIILQDKNVAEEVALIENIQRKNLHPLELMEGFRNLLDKGVCKNQQEIADKLGIARTIVVEILGLSKLPSSTQEALLQKKIKSRDVLRILLKSPKKDHNQIISNEEQKKQKIEQKKLVSKERKSRLVSIYLQSEKLVFDEIENWVLTLEQKKQIKKYLQNLIKKIEPKY